MNLRQLMYFYETSLNENLSKTAEKYMVPSSSVSASIKRLEDELGVKLFERTANKLHLNAKGQLFAEELRESFRRIDQTVQRITAKEVEKPVLRIVIQARPKWLTELIAEFQSKHPNINFIISIDYALRSFNSFDVVIGEKCKSLNEWDHFLLSSEIICVKAAINSPLLYRELTFRQLANEPFVLPCIGNGMRNLYEKTCKQHGFQPNVAIECNDRQCLQYYVETGMALTVGAYRALNDHSQDGIAPLNVLDFNATQEVYVFYRKTSPVNIPLKEFCDFLYFKRYI